MFASDRFALQPMQKYSQISSGVPVLICCSRQCTEVRSGVPFLQLRMRNLTDRLICSVFLTIEGFALSGKRVFRMREVIVPDCNAKSGELFGEARMIAIEAITADTRITVERVVFDDGMIWCKATAYRPMVFEPVREEPEPIVGSAPSARIPQQPTELLEGDRTLPSKEQMRLGRGTTEPLALKSEQRPAPIVRESLPMLPVMQNKQTKVNALPAWILVAGGIVLAVGAVLVLLAHGNFSLFF